MKPGAKVYGVSGEGSPIGSRETLRAAMLLDLGFKPYVDEKGVSKCFQDVTIEQTGNRYFSIIFDGRYSVAINGSVVGVRDAGEAIATGEPAILAEKRWIYQNFEPKTQPVKQLSALTDDLGLIEMYQALLKKLQTLPRLAEVQANGRRYFLTHGATPEQWAAEMAVLD